MEPDQHVVYFNNEETASSYTHQTINKDFVDLCKFMAYFRRWKLGMAGDEISMLPHQIMEGRINRFRYIFLYLEHNQCSTILQQIK